MVQEKQFRPMFVHPTTHEKMRFEIGLEPTFERVLNELREGEE